MISSVSNTSIDPGTLLLEAEATQDKSASEDEKSAKQAKDVAFKDEIESGKKSIRDQRKAADERAKHGQKKSNGSLIGLGVGGALGGLSIAFGIIACLIPGGQAVGAALIGLGAALIAAGAPAGGAAGNSAGRKNEKRANQAQERSELSKLIQKEAEKVFEESKDRAGDANQLQDQVRDDKRERARDSVQNNARYRA